ncbi:CD109 antigen-like [Chironomus tepperi]|uniref:CD109 antigen-like n=1 Tax=Chironomus tepperi TaxID=113505 RepID=UPI00391F7C21
MKLILKILIFIVGLSVSKSEHVSLIGSHHMPTNSDYKVYLAAQDLTEDSILNVTLESDGDDGVSKVFEGVSGDLSQEIDFQLPRNHPSSYKLNIIHKSRTTNKCMRQSVTVGDTRNCHMIFIQHDKPVYKNGDVIKFRTFVLDRDMLPYRYTSMTVTIMDGRKNVIKRLENVQTTNFGVFEDYLIVSESPNLGIWRIEVVVDGMTRSKHFPVKQQQESGIDVLVQSMDREVPFDDMYVLLQILAKSSVNKVFTGTAKISCSARFDGKDERVIDRFIKNVTLPVDKNIVSLRIDNDLGIQSPTADMIATFKVEVLEDKKFHFETVTVDVPLRMYRNRLEVERKPYFKPGFDFDMTIKAKTLNGDPDKSLRTLTMTVDYEEFDEETHKSSTNKQSFKLILKNGELYVPLHPTEITKSMKVIFEFGNSELIERIPKMDNNGVDEYMQATIENKKQSYDTTDILNLKATSSGSLQTLNVLIIGSTGLMYSKSYPEARGKSNFKFNLQLSSQMSPEAYIFVFYARAEDGVIISDEQQISLKYTTGNMLEITPVTQSSKPGGSVTFNIKSAKDSRVFLTAVDQNVALLGRGNEISQLFVYSEVARYMNQNMNGNYSVGRFNSFVLQPLVSGVPCDSNMDSDVMTSRPTGDAEATFEDQVAQQYFPNVWFDGPIDIKSDFGQTIQKQVPNDFTSWIVYGVSMHPTKGFAVVKKEASVSVYSEIGLRVYTPESIDDGEVLNVEFNVYNFLTTTQGVQVIATVENGDIMDERTTTINKKTCKKYTRRSSQTAVFNPQVPATSMSPTQNLFIRPTGLSAMRIKIIATTSNGGHDEVTRVVRVEDRRNMKESGVESFLIELGDSGSVQQNVVMNLSPNTELVDVYAMFSGNLLGPVLKDLQMYSNAAPKTNMFRLSMIIAQYHQVRHETIPIEIMDEMLMGYQYTLETLQRDQSQADIYKTSLFVANAACNLIEAKNYIDVNDDVIEYVLDFLKTKQTPNGGFDDGRSDVIDSADGSYGHILTAQVTLAFIKYQKYSHRYDDVINKAMSFLDSSKPQLTTDYEKARIAYTFSARGDQVSAKYLTSSMTCIFGNNADFQDKTPLYVQVASYLIEIKIIDGEDPRMEVEWLLRQRKPDGTFFSPHNTLEAMRALLTYAQHRNINGMNMRVSIDGRNGIVTDEMEIVRMKLARKDQYSLSATGTGLGYATVYYTYVQKETTNQANSNFIVKVDTKEMRDTMLEITVDVKLVAAGISTCNLAVIEIEMPSGYLYHGHTNGAHIKKVDHMNGRTVVVFYIGSLEANQVYRHVMQGVKMYQVENTSKSTVSVYDYYRPSIRDEIQYDYDVNQMNCNPRYSEDQATGQKKSFWQKIG